MTKRSEEYVILGKIGAPYGIKGWIKVHSFTASPGDLFNYTPWVLKNDHGQQRNVVVTDHKEHGKGWVAKIQGYDTPETVRMLTGYGIEIKQSQLPALEENEYYWRDLEGLTVINQEGKILGKIIYLLETGANDVLVVKNENEKEHAIPFLRGSVILSVNLNDRVMRVNWEEI